MFSKLVKSGRIWPVIIIGLLALNIGIATLTLVLATRDESFAVEPDYYQKAVAWDEHARDREAQARLGWTLKAEVGPADARGARLMTATFRARDGASIDGATLSGECFHNAVASCRVPVTLLPTGRAGEYSAVVPMARSGEWTLDLKATAPGGPFEARLDLFAGGPGK